MEFRPFWIMIGFVSGVGVIGISSLVYWISHKREMEIKYE